MAEAPGGNDSPGPRNRVWQRRPGLSRAVRIAVFAVPAATSFSVALLLGHLLPQAHSAATHVLAVLVVAAASLVTLLVVERGTRRLLPLAALLNLSLIFPDKAPARFAVARRRGRPRDLQAALQHAKQTGHAEDAARMGTVIELVLALSVHDRASRGHSERVRVFTELIADELKVPESGRNRLCWAALLHDIGKLTVPAVILNKSGKPTTEEWAVLHRHPEEGARLVAPLLPWMGEWGLAVVQHHERFDGTGYPHHLKGHEISLAARIVSVADTYEVITAPRPYQRARSVMAARRELVRVAGTQLDPAVVRAFLNISVGRLWQTIGFAAWIGQIPTLARLFSFGSWAGAGVATATTATVIAVSGLTGVVPGPSPVAPSATSGAVALAPGHHLTPTGLATAGGSTRPGGTATPGGGPGAPPRPGATTPPTSATQGPTPSPRSTPVPTPRRTPVPTPRSTPTPTPPPPTPTPPVPTPDPWSCANCNGTGAACADHCTGGDLKSCTTYCSGDNNKACTSHCFGNNNKQCLIYCVGTNNKKCQKFCRIAPTILLMALPQPPSRREPRQADTTLNPTMITTIAMVMRPLY